MEVCLSVCVKNRERENVSLTSSFIISVPSSQTDAVKQFNDACFSSTGSVSGHHDEKHTCGLKHTYTHNYTHTLLHNKFNIAYKTIHTGSLSQYESLSGITLCF